MATKKKATKKKATKKKATKKKATKKKATKKRATKKKGSSGLDGGEVASGGFGNILDPAPWEEPDDGWTR